MIQLSGFTAAVDELMLAALKRQDPMHQEAQREAISNMSSDRVMRITQLKEQVEEGYDRRVKAMDDRKVPPGDPLRKRREESHLRTLAELDALGVAKLRP